MDTHLVAASAEANSMPDAQQLRPKRDTPFKEFEHSDHRRPTGPVAALPEARCGSIVLVQRHPQLFGGSLTQATPQPQPPTCPSDVPLLRRPRPFAVTRIAPTLAIEGIERG